MIKHTEGGAWQIETCVFNKEFRLSLHAMALSLKCYFLVNVIICSIDGSQSVIGNDLMHAPEYSLGVSAGYAEEAPTAVRTVPARALPIKCSVNLSMYLLRTRQS